MLNVTMSSDFERAYKLLPENLRKQIKLTIKKISNCPNCKSLNIKYHDSKRKLYEFYVSNGCKVIWKFKSSNNRKSIILLNILCDVGADEIMGKLSIIDKTIKNRQKQD